MDYIPLFRNRDFGMLFTDSIQYVIKNARSLYLPLLMYAAPVLAIGGIISGYYSQDILNGYMDAFRDMASGGSFQDSLMELSQLQQDSPIWALFLASLISIIGSVIQAGIVYQHMITYSQNPEAVEDREELRTEAFGFLGKLLWTMVVLGLFIFLFVIGYSLLVGLTAALTPFLGALVGIAGMVYMIYLGVPLAMLYIVVMKEGLRPLEAMRRCYQLIKGHWWKFFGVLVVMYIVVAIVSAVINIPATMLSASGGAAMVISQIVIAAVSVVLNTPLLVAGGMQYFSTSGETGEDQYIGDVIDEIGGEQEEKGFR